MVYEPQGKGRHILAVLYELSAGDTSQVFTTSQMAYVLGSRWNDHMGKHLRLLVKHGYVLKHHRWGTRCAYYSLTPSALEFYGRVLMVARAPEKWRSDANFHI